MVININVKGKTAQLAEAARIVCGNSDYKVKFIFDDDWAAHPVKTARFFSGGEYTDVIFEGEECNAPIMRNTTGVFIGVYAGDLFTTTAAYVPCDKSILCNGGSPSEPAPDVYAQLMALLNKYIDISEGLTEDEVKIIIERETRHLAWSEVVDAQLEEKVDKYNGAGIKTSQSVYGVETSNGAQVQIPVEHQLYSTSRGAIVKRYGLHILVPEKPEEIGVPNLYSKVATSKWYVDKATAPIADHEKRIENLENTLLTYIEDTESGYEKPVPVGVGKNAVLSSIGKTEKSSNLLDPSVFVKLNRNVFSVNADGGLHIKSYGNISYTTKISLGVGTYTINETLIDDSEYKAGCIFENNSSEITITEPAEVGVKVEVWEETECDFRVWVHEGRTVKPFEPYGAAPVTAVESYGSNLFNPQWLIDYVQDNYKGNIEPYGNGLRISSYPCKTNITFAKFLELTGLKVGDTFTSASTVIDAVTGERLTSGTYNITFEHSGDGTWLDITSPNPKYPKKITITEDMLKYQQLNIYMEDAKTTPRYVVDITLTKTDTLLPYEPYSAEPIDTFIIPQEIQTLNGYGKSGFILDLERKTATYEGKTTDVSAYLAGYDKFKTVAVQGGGKVRLVNEYKLAVPSMITYVKARE